MAGKGKKTETESEEGYEEKVKRLEEIVLKLETGGATLEESMALFENGSRLLSECREMLGASEKRMELLLADVGEITVMDDMLESDVVTDDDGGTE